MKTAALVTLISILATNVTHGCTTFVLKDSTNLVYGRNFDWDIGCGFIVINKRAIEKQAFVQPPNKPASWVSKFGSITFNQIGVDAPMCGMNEKGLVIAQMGLFESKFTESDEKLVIGELEWIQYQLDMSATIKDVIENNINVRISPVAVPVHYMICDSLGSIAVIEYLNGELVVHQGDNISIPVASNMIYEKSKSELKLYKGFGGQKEIPAQWDNVSDMIAIAGSKINEYKNSGNNDPVDYSFGILNAVGSAVRTQWSVVYDIKNRIIHFKTLNDKNVRTLALDSFEYSCGNEINIIDLQKSSNGSKISDQFTKLSFDYYFNYKKNLIALYKSNMPGFPDIPDEIIRLEVENILNRKCKK